MQSLGLEMNTAVIAVAGRVTEEDAILFARQVISKIGMSYKFMQDGKESKLVHKTWNFPVGAAGGGGVGDTVMQPCFTLVQPLLESYTAVVPGVIGVDTWQEHDSFYLIINSCRYFSIRRLVRYLMKCGWRILDYSYSVCRTKPAEPRSWLGRKLWG